MKIPLHYQVSEYDCGPTTMMNAISFLFSREEIPPEVPKYIMLYCLDAYNGKGEYGKSGTSCMAMMFLSNWLNQFGKARGLPISCTYLSGEEVRIEENSQMIAALQQGGAVMVRLLYGCWHYVLLTGIRQDKIEVFDPYFRKKPFKNREIEIVTDQPDRVNRRVPFSCFNQEKRAPYALGAVETREAVLLFNQDTRKTPDRTIEYFI